MSHDWSSWSAKEVSSWVQNIGPKFRNLAEEFEQAGVTGKFLDIITDEDLKEMGLESNFLRRLFKQNLNVLRSSTVKHSGSKKRTVDPAEKSFFETTYKEKRPKSKRHPVSLNLKKKQDAGQGKANNAMRKSRMKKLTTMQPSCQPVRSSSSRKKQQKKANTPLSSAHPHTQPLLPSMQQLQQQSSFVQPKRNTQETCQYSANKLNKNKPFTHQDVTKNSAFCAKPAISSDSHPYSPHTSSHKSLSTNLNSTKSHSSHLLTTTNKPNINQTSVKSSNTDKKNKKHGDRNEKMIYEKENKNYDKRQKYSSQQHQQQMQMRNHQSKPLGEYSISNTHSYVVPPNYRFSYQNNNFENVNRNSNVTGVNINQKHKKMTALIHNYDKNLKEKKRNQKNDKMHKNALNSSKGSSSMNKNRLHNGVNPSADCSSGGASKNIKKKSSGGSSNGGSGKVHKKKKYVNKSSGSSSGGSGSSGSKKKDKSRKSSIKKKKKKKSSEKRQEKEYKGVEPIVVESEVGETVIDKSVQESSNINNVVDETINFINDQQMKNYSPSASPAKLEAGKNGNSVKLRRGGWQHKNMMRSQSSHLNGGQKKRHVIIAKPKVSHAFEQRTKIAHASRSQPPPKRSTPRNKPSHQFSPNVQKMASSASKSSNYTKSRSVEEKQHPRHIPQQPKHQYHHAPQHPLKAHSASPLPSRMGNSNSGPVNIRVASRSRRTPKKNATSHSKSEINRARAYSAGGKYLAKHQQKTQSHFFTFPAEEPTEFPTPDAYTLPYNPEHLIGASRSDMNFKPEHIISAESRSAPSMQSSSKGKKRNDQGRRETQVRQEFENDKKKSGSQSRAKPEKIKQSEMKRSETPPSSNNYRQHEPIIAPESSTSVQIERKLNNSQHHVKQNDQARQINRHFEGDLALSNSLKNGKIRSNNYREPVISPVRKNSKRRTNTAPPKIRISQKKHTTHSGKREDFYGLEKNEGKGGRYIPSSKAAIPGQRFIVKQIRPIEGMRFPLHRHRLNKANQAVPMTWFGEKREQKNVQTTSMNSLISSSTQTSSTTISSARDSGTTSSSTSQSNNFLGIGALFEDEIVVSEHVIQRPNEEIGEQSNIKGEKDDLVMIIDEAIDNDEAVKAQICEALLKTTYQSMPPSISVCHDENSVGGDEIDDQEGSETSPTTSAIRPPPRLSVVASPKFKKQNDGEEEIGGPEAPMTTEKPDSKAENEVNSELMESTGETPGLGFLEVSLPRPRNADEAYLEFSNSIALCVCSLQLGHEYLELIYQLSDRLYGREQVNYDLSQASITRSLSSNYEFVQLLNLIGFELENNMLVCRNKPHATVLEVFQKHIKQYQFSGLQSYDTSAYKDELTPDMLKLLQILMAVTHENAQTNEDLMKSFVLFLPYLSDCNTILRLLHFWWEACENHFEDTLNVRFAVATLLKHLIEQYKLEIMSDSVYESLASKIRKEEPIGYSHIEAIIRESNSNIQTLPFLIQNTISNVNNILNVPPISLADNLTLSNFNLFTSIPMMDFFEQNRTTSKLATFITRYENIQRWVMITIYQAANADERANRLRLFFKIAERLRENQDIFAFFAVYHALNSPEIQSFETSWKLVFVKKFRSKREYDKIWTEWKSLCTKPGRAMDTFWKLRPPGIPHVHAVSAVMDWIPKFQSMARDAVELLCHLRKVYPFVKKLQKLQKTLFTVEADISVINALEAEFLLQSKLNVWNIRSLYIQALNVDSIPVPQDVLKRMNHRPNFKQIKSAFFGSPVKTGTQLQQHHTDLLTEQF